MPNWCECDLTLVGDDKQVGDFLEDAKNKESSLSLEKLYPMPKDYETQEGYNKYGYDWCVKHWGTKWDLDSVELIDESEGWAEFSFMTAWSPPLNAFEKISKAYPKIQFRLHYKEGGVGFEGVAKIENGETQDASIQY